MKALKPTKRQVKQSVQPEYAGKESAGSGRKELQKYWDAFYKGKDGVKEVRISRFFLFCCPGARAFTYARAKGTDVRLMDGIPVEIPDEYLEGARKHSMQQTEFKMTMDLHKNKFTYPKHRSIEEWIKEVCTLQYCAWDGFWLTPIYCEGAFP